MKKLNKSFLGGPGGRFFKKAPLAAGGKVIILMILILTISHPACKKVPFYAVEGATLIISTDKNYLGTGGDRAVITVIGFNAEGEALHDHTTVIFSATLGTVTPAQVEIISGRAVVEFHSGELSGIAQIRARSGTIVAEPDPLEIIIGSAALETLTISANPSTFPPGGGRSRVRVFAFDAGGNLLAGIPVVLSATSGHFENPAAVYTTDNQGMVEDFLHITQTAAVAAEAGAKIAEVEIQVEEQAENQSPTADFSYSPSAPKRGENVHFNGSPSTDPDGTIVSWQWDFGDGRTGSGETVSHKFDWSGESGRTFTVILKVTDNSGGQGVTSRTVTIETEDQNQLPNADFSYSPSSPQKGETIHFNGALSSDPDGSIVSWQWDFGDGSSDSGETVSHVYDWTGTDSKTFTVVLTVTDDGGGSSVVSRTVTVQGGDENQSPTADFSYSPTSPKKGETVHFNGSLSTDADGSIVSWQWDFGDGSGGTGERVDHRYRWNDEGSKTFTVILIVTDDDGAQSHATKTITVVGEDENQPPTASFSYSPTSPKKGETVYFNGGLSTDSDGSIVSWQWDFGDGETGVGETVEHLYDWAGTGSKTFVVVLTVRDNDGGEDTVSVNVTVE